MLALLSGLAECVGWNFFDTSCALSYVWNLMIHDT